MRTITSFQEVNRFLLKCSFNDNTEKNIDLTQFINSEAFRFLKDNSSQYYITNEKYHLVWHPYDVDLSADTLWHIGN